MKGVRSYRKYKVTMSTAVFDLRPTGYPESDFFEAQTLLGSWVPLQGSKP